MLSAAHLDSRRRYDLGAVVQTFAAVPGLVFDMKVYAGKVAALRGREANVPEQISVYDVWFRWPTLAGPHQIQQVSGFRVDASDGDYPFVAPTVTALGDFPWSPHVNPSTGWVCGGNVWAPSKLLAHLLVDLLRILNFDEDPGKLAASNGHFNRAATDYWLNALGGRPLRPPIYPRVIEPQDEART